MKIVVSNSLQMSWCGILPFFCCGLETARDLMEMMWLQDLPPQRFEDIILQKDSKTIKNKHNNGLVPLLEIYVDNFSALRNDTQNAHL